MHNHPEWTRLIARVNCLTESRVWTNVSISEQSESQVM